MKCGSGPESLKLTKLKESKDIEAYLITFERAVQAHGVDEDNWSFILGPQLTGKAMQAYAAMSNKDLQDYGKVKEAMFQLYDINEETYRWRLMSKENKTPE